MKVRSLFFVLLAVLLGTAFLFSFIQLVSAQDGPPGKPGLPTPTPNPLDKTTAPAAIEASSALVGVDFSRSSFNARGAHPGEAMNYTLSMVNQGVMTATATELDITFPINATYLPGSAQVQGGGALSIHPGHILWSGAVASGTSVTVTFQAILPDMIGTVVTASASLYDPGLPAAITLSNYLEVQAPAGGPDPYGYTFQDNLAPGSSVGFNWIPVSGLSTKIDFGGLPADDVVSGTLPIGFPFHFYGNTYTDMYINTNGLVMFGAGSIANVPYPIPTQGNVDNLASCFWSDLYILDSSQGIWVETFGNTPNHYTVITFKETYFADWQAMPAEFQMILSEGSNQIKCQYLHTDGPVYGSGGQSTIGLENADGTAGLGYYYNLDNQHTAIGPLENNLAIEFYPGPAALPVYVTSAIKASANVHPGDHATYTVLIRNSGTATGATTAMYSPIPAGATYVNGSASVQGGGVLNANSASINWNGSVAAGSTVTVTYQVALPITLGSQLENTTVIDDPQAAAPFSITNREIVVLPPPSGGPDAFGYTFNDSYAGAGVTYSWVPTTTSSTKVNFGPVIVDDVATGPLPIGFPFRFYANTYTDFYVSSNGLVSFGTGFDQNINQPIPQVDMVQNFAACFWYDLYIQNASQGVWYETYGSSPNRTTVITFRAQFFTTNSSLQIPPSLFQMILSEGSNQIKCQYAEMTGSYEASGGTGATVGLENVDGTSGVQYFYLPTYPKPTLGPLEDNLAIVFTPGAVIPAFSTSSKTVSGAMHPGQAANYTIRIANNSAIPSTLTHMTDLIPADTTYLNGTAQVVGGGLLTPSSSAINWQGTVGSGQAVTVTFGVGLHAPSGLVTNTATIEDPAASIPIAKSAVSPIQPVFGMGTGSPLYVYNDNYGPDVTFDWIAPSVSATKLVINTGDPDDGFGSVPLGFSFPFFDRSFSTVQVSTNGLVMFNDAGSADYQNQPILTPGTVDNFASCFWDDMLINNAAQGIWSETLGSSPNRNAVITFILQTTNLVATQPYQFQMILSENGDITCQYNDMSGFVDGDGRSATIGIEDRLGTSGLAYFNERTKTPIIGPVENGLAVVFSKIYPLYLPVIRH